MTMPNFLIIGAPKAGTTALFHYLKQHPQIYMSPVKEPAFFAFEGLKLESNGPDDKVNNRPQESIEWYRQRIGSSITNLEDYQTLFQGVSSQKIALGEASPAYMYFPRAHERIHYYIPDVKLIAILRHPTDRAYSSFLHRAQHGLDYLTDVNQILKKEDYNIRDVWWGFRHNVRIGFYYDQLKRYFDKFDKNQIKVYLYEDLETNGVGLLQDIFQFLGVDETFVPDVSTKHLVSAIPKNKVWHQILTKPNPIKAVFKAILPEDLGKRIAKNLRKQNLGKPQLAPEVRQELNQLYREDILKLQDLLGRDLSKWLA